MYGMKRCIGTAILLLLCLHATAEARRLSPSPGAGVIRLPSNGRVMAPPGYPTYTCQLRDFCPDGYYWCCVGMGLPLPRCGCFSKISVGLTDHAISATKSSARKIDEEKTTPRSFQDQVMTSGIPTPTDGGDTVGSVVQVAQEMFGTREEGQKPE
ncbi:uncharacterized protein LOC123409876 isoform X1 [Hordeum vulgare subsp. vulgare]|uniref:uncharacterized protein LOC123409876 isoform X1 n=1 Tax=Hordeum vulgare subsp. vulgare TaxID=112509 RepID=UPI000B46319C|nr:uncharacterized protein LOC123409876 isoform X1 [Hordeum vulgare subsp. vulgare]